MRSFFQPQSSIAHRLTCTSLYRHLLRQCRQFDKPIANTLRNLISHRFHIDKAIRPPNVIAESISKARHALQVLGAASQGSVEATHQLLHLIETTEQHAIHQHQLRRHQNNLRRPTAPHKLRKVAHLNKTRSKFWADRVPDPIPVQDRPVPLDKLPGKRRIPTFAHVHGFPFLRYKPGPTSPWLSRWLFDSFTTERKRWAQKAEMEEAVQHLKLEDMWDVTTGFKEGGWTAATSGAINEVKNALKVGDVKKDERALNMWRTVKLERALWRRERAEKKIERLERLIGQVDRGEAQVEIVGGREELVKQLERRKMEAEEDLEVAAERTTRPYCF